MIKLYADGCGGTNGAGLATRKQLLTTNKIVYLSSTTGSNANSGLDRKKAKATLAGALAEMDPGDILCVLAAHVERLVAPVISSLGGISIVGEGVGASIPKFTKATSGEGITLSGSEILLDNLRFAASEPWGEPGATVVLTGDAVIQNCVFECGAADYGAAKLFSAPPTGECDLIISGCTFTSVATSGDTLPSGGLTKQFGVLIADALVFDGGVYGWNSPALTMDGTMIRATDIDLLNGSDIDIASGTIGYVQMRNKTGTAAASWDAA